MAFFLQGLRTATRSRLASNISRVGVSTTWRAAYSAKAGLTRDAIQKRILGIVGGFEKVDPAKLNPASSFTEDLGLDSLDTVEVVMAVEEEFSIEIPDAEADEIKTVQQAIEYIAKTPEAS